MDYRLPTTVVPKRYDLRLEPDLAAAPFADLQKRIGRKTLSAKLLAELPAVAR